jgi:hypothetical protein
MKSNVRATNHQRQANVNNLLTPEMRQQVRQLKHELDEYDRDLFGHLEILSGIREALAIARQSARCLLMNDPFEAWEKIAKRREEEMDAVCDASTAEKQDTRRTQQSKTNVDKLITLEMRKRVVEAKTKLDDYAKCLGKFFHDVTELQSLDTAMELAEDLQCDEPLETAEAHKKREAAVEDEDLDER